MIGTEIYISAGISKTLSEPYLLDGSNVSNAMCTGLSKGVTLVDLGSSRVCAAYIVGEMNGEFKADWAEFAEPGSSSSNLIEESIVVSILREGGREYSAGTEVIERGRC